MIPVTCRCGGAEIRIFTGKQTLLNRRWAETNGPTKPLIESDARDSQPEKKRNGFERSSCIVFLTPKWTELERQNKVECTAEAFSRVSTGNLYGKRPTDEFEEFRTYLDFKLLVNLFHSGQTATEQQQNSRSAEQNYNRSGWKRCGH